MNINKIGNYIFNISTTLFLVWFLITSLQYEKIERMIPLLIVIPTLMMQLYVTIHGFFFAHAEGGNEEISAARHEWLSAAKIILWILWFTLLLFAVGFYLSLIIFAALFFYIEAKLTVLRSFVSTLAVFVFIYGMFQLALKIKLWPGAIVEIIPNIMGGGVLPPL